MDIDAVTPVFPPRRLPVWDVATRSYDYVWQHRGRLARPLALVLAAAFIGNLADAYLDPDTGTDATNPLPAILSSCAASFVATLTAAALAVGLHRWILLDEFRAGAAMLRWDANFRRYVLTMLGLGAVSLGPLIVTGSVAAIILRTPSMDSLDIAIGGAVFLALVWLLVSFRFSLALPAAALGTARAFRLSWQVTRGNTWRMVGLTVALTLPFIILGVIVAMLPGSESTSVIAQLPTLILRSLEEASYGVVCVVSLSLGYDILVRGGDGHIPEY